MKRQKNQHFFQGFGFCLQCGKYRNHKIKKLKNSKTKDRYESQLQIEQKRIKIDNHNVMSNNAAKYGNQIKW